MLLLIEPLGLVLIPTNPPSGRFHLRPSVSMTWIAALERSAKYNSARFGLTKLMSNDRSGAPDIWIAVRHLVWVVSGGEKSHVALALVAANDMAPTTPDRHASSLDFVIMDVFPRKHFDFAPDEGCYLLFSH
jgi:hypothetical protein